MEAENHTLESLSVGQSASFEQVITVDAIAQFAALSGDHNPLHTDEAYAASTKFGRPIAHGMLLGALLSRLVGMQLPGKRCLYLSQTLAFKNPASAGDLLRVEGTIESVSIATRIVCVRTTITRGGTVLVEGIASVQVI